MKSISIALTSSAILLFTGCGSSKVAHASMVNSEKSYASQVNTKSVNKQGLPTHLVTLNRSQQKDFLNQINRVRSERRSCGKYGSMGPVHPLAWSERLYDAALIHSYDMAASSHFSHDGSGSRNDRTAIDMRLDRGSTLRDRMSYAQYKWRAVGENIAAGQHTPQAAMDAWLRSDEHCKNLMSADFTEVGMAYYSSKDQYKTYWAQNFGDSLKFQ